MGAQPGPSPPASSEQALREYRWGSWPEYLKSPKRRWAWLRVDRLLGEYQVPKDSQAGRQHLGRWVEERRAAEDSQAYQPVRRGWCLGDQRLRKELLAQMGERLGPEHDGEERREAQEETAERVLAEEMRRRRWTEATLGQRAKGDPQKVKLAVRLRRETLRTVAWIAKRLRGGQCGPREHAAGSLAPQQNAKLAVHKTPHANG